MLPLLPANTYIRLTPSRAFTDLNSSSADSERCSRLGPQDTHKIPTATTAMQTYKLQHRFNYRCTC